MKCYKIILQYNGSNYHGWHSQTNAPTVCKAVKRAFSGAFGHDCLVKAASRTDAGVHAIGQVLRLSCELSLPEKRVFEIFNAALPQDIVLASLESCDQDFNPLENVVQKEYRYKIYKTKQEPLIGPWGWYCHWNNYIDWQRFEDILSIFAGTHNFRAFCKIEPGETRTTVRKVDSVTIIQNNANEIIISIKAPGFLRYQVRRMIGCALEFAKKKYFSRQEIELSLATGTALPSALDYKASASGLCLISIEYGSNQFPEQI